MKKSDELCKEPEEMKCEGEGIVSGCGYEKGFGDKDDGYEKQSKRQGE